MSLDPISSPPTHQTTANQHAQRFQQPIEANFLTEFNRNKEDVEWLKKVNGKYGDKISNLSYPFVIERIINRLTSRKRSHEIYEHIDKYLHYYHTYSLQIENITNINIKYESLLLKFCRIYMYGYDKQGHPIMFDEITSSDITEICNAIQSNIEEKHNGDTKQSDDIYDNLQELLRQFRFKFYGKMSYLKQIQSKKRNTLIFKHMLVMDLQNFSYYNIISNVSIFSNGTSPLNMIKCCINDERLLYPQELYKLFLINCPWSFQLLWSVISNFIGTESQKKVKILGTDYMDEMLKDIEIDQIPKKYGGTGKWSVKLGEMCNCK